MNNTIIKNNNDFNVIPFEKCVLCNAETQIPIDKNIDFRENYVEGIGQLCLNCYQQTEK